MGTRRQGIHLGYRSLGPSGAVSHEEATFCLDRPDAAAPFDKVIALVEGEPAQQAESLAKIREAFTAGGPADQLADGEEEQYLRGVLNSALPKMWSGQKPGAAILLCRGDIVIAGSAGDARIAVVRATDGAVQPPAETELDKSGQVWRSVLGPEDSVVLFNAVIRRLVPDNEVRQAVHGCDPVDAASWLATLGYTRSQSHSTAVVAMRASHAKMRDMLGQFEPPTLPARSFAPPVRWVASGVGLLALLALILVVVPAIDAGSTKAVTYLPPNGLVSNIQSGNHVVLSWRSRPGVSDYQYEIQYPSGSSIQDSDTNPSAVVHTSFVGGTAYPWRVRALYGGVRSASKWSQWQVFTMSPGSTVAKPVAVSPLGSIVLKRKLQEMNFCWTVTGNVSRFDLRISGGGLHVHSVLPVASVTKRQNGELCSRQTVAAHAHLSWLIGARFSSGQTSWSGWVHALTKFHHNATPVISTVSTPVQTSSDTGSSTSGSTTVTGSTTTQSTTTTSTASSTSSSSKGSSPVVECSNPPHC